MAKFPSQHWKLFDIRRIKQLVLWHATNSSMNTFSPISISSVTWPGRWEWFQYVNDKHSLLQLKLRQSLDGSMSKQRILPLQVFLALDSLLSASFPHRQLAHCTTLTRFQFLRAIQDPSVFGHPLFERVLVCGKKRKEEIKDWCLPCKKQLPR